MFDFSGKSAVITGAASGIGLATAEYFLRAGGRVTMADINADALAAAADRLGAGPERLAYVRYDAADPESAGACIDHAVAAFGGIDHLVAAAGIYDHKPLGDMADADWRRMLSVNLDGLYYLTSRALPHMVDGGAIVAVASVAAHQGGTLGNVHYGATKGAVLAFTKGLAREVAPRLRANCVSPGWIETPMIAQSMARAGADIAKNIPLQRVGQPHEIASIIAFLCSDASSFVTGEAIIASGGAYMA